MPKDNENIPFLGPVEPSEPQGFSAEQMIRCEECLRANPPTRITCLYCVAPLPLTEASARLRKPVLRPPEKHQPGYNIILLPQDQVPSQEMITQAVELLKLSAEKLHEILSQGIPLPVARTASREEAELVFNRLQDLGLGCLNLSDHDLGLSENAVKRVKSMAFADEYLTIQLVAEETVVAWTDIILILPARLIETRVEITERMNRKPEKEILDASEFFRDEAVIDFYTSAHSSTWRVSANGFDFSCLGKEKALVANENFSRLKRVIISRAVNANVDESYQRVRNVLELAWTTQPDIQSSGWRREGPGKLSVGMATTKSNETQFTRYSRLLHYLRLSAA
ncbi:MAG TPA: hypothetical protein VJM50_17335 [Pyrinomonadaceae bacterium]|nr:hypothetical protein [Pyrinomonadaceae bacterium]